MLNLIFAALAGIAASVITAFAGFGWIATIVPGVIVFLGALVLLGRRTFGQLQVIFKAVQEELSTMTANPKEQKVKADKAIKLLETALPYGKWQFLVEGEIHGQIGMIRYLFKDYDGAMVAFQKTGPRNYLVRAMQAAVYFQRKDYDAMERSFEEAVKHGKKEGLMWAAYAWCLQQTKASDKAMKVLARGVEVNPTDDKLKSALTALQNDKRLKMKAWEPQWWQLGLETPPMPQPQFMPNRRGRMMRR